jgi:hypothetical protein
MNLENLSAEVLLMNTKALVHEERQITLAVLQHLREIEKRKLHLELGFESMYDYAMQELGYSEGEAQRRVSAMKLMKDIPQVEEKIASGSLSLTNAVKIQSHFYQAAKTEKLSAASKIELIERLENTSTRQCERELLKLAPKDYVPRERERAVTEEHTEIRMIVTSKLKEKIQKVKGLLSHKKLNPSMAEMLEMLCDDLIQRKDPARRKVSSAPKKSPAPTRNIPAAVKNEVWRRDESCCSFVDERTGRRCKSHQLVQMDHVIPRYYGGQNTVENLRLLCFQHHKLVTEIAFPEVRAFVN